MVTPSIASFLSSPTIRLILPPVKSESSEDKTYIVHRSLLSAHTSLLKSRRTRDSYVVLDPYTVDVPTVERVLEFFYTGDYNLPEELEPPEDEDDETLLRSLRPAAHLPQNSPLLAAAMAGQIGVWGKPAPRFEKVANTSTYTSIYFPKEKPAKVQVITDNFTNGVGKEKPNPFLPSPPASPVFQTYSPILASKPIPKQAEKLATMPHHLFLLRAHISLYRFSNIPTVNIPGLSTLTLSKMAALFQSTKPSDLPSLTIDFATIVFQPYRGEGELRKFLLDLVVSRIGELSQKTEFNNFVRKGGEFVVDVLGSLAVARAAKP
jgi:hypothetical protein